MTSFWAMHKKNSKTASYGALYHGIRILKGPNNSSHTGSRLNRTPDVPEGNRTAKCPSWRKFCHTSHKSIPCLEAIKLICLKAQARGVSTSMMQGTWDPLGKPLGSVGLPGRPVMAQEGPIGLGDACNTGSSSFRDALAL